MTNSDTYQAALEYARRGWSLVALHWITAAGQCSCGTVGCKSAGKHPLDKRWQTLSAPPGRWATATGELENIGIRTGRASGFWVLDFDPADADDAGRELEHLIWKAGLHPHVRTGGGGYHWRFAMPDDGREIRNRQSAGGGAGRTHGLPRGWDVRGEGGQVVAPPSVSAKGAYVELGEPPAGWCPYTAPAWLLEMVTPPSHTVPSAGPASAPIALPGGIAGGEAAGTAFGESSHSAERVQAYCTAALIAECDEYASLTDGRRGEAAAAFGRRLVELANLARWPLDAVAEHFERAMHAASRNGGGGGYAPHEVAGQWARAVEHVGGRAAVMPLGLDILPGFTSFPSVGVAGLADLRIVEPGDVPHGANGAAPVTGMTPVPSGPMPPAAPPIGLSQSVWSKVQALDDLDAAKRWRAARDMAARPPLESELLAGDALDAVADPVPVVDGWLFADSLARLNGRPGQGKSFAAIDIACSVATGTAWHGNAVRQGTVLLIVAEGVSGVRRRIRAWERVHGVKVGDALIVLPRAVQVTSPEWLQLVGVAASRRVALVVVDTQARVTAGLNENLSADMGLFVQALEDLRAATGACVLTVHHKGKGEGEGGRGSNAVEGAMVSEFDVWKRGHVVTVKNTKQKDIEGGYQIEFSLQVDGDSAVLVYKVEIIEPIGGESWRAQARALYEILRAHSGAAGITKADAKAAAMALAVFSEGNTPKYMGTLFGYAWNNLIMRGLLIRHVESKQFGVHVMADVGSDGVLTPNVGDHQVADPVGWQTYAPDAVDATADWSMNIGKTGGTRVSAAIKKLPSKDR